MKLTQFEKLFSFVRANRNRRKPVCFIFLTIKKQRKKYLLKVFARGKFLHKHFDSKPLSILNLGEKNRVAARFRSSKNHWNLLDDIEPMLVISQTIIFLTILNYKARPFCCKVVFSNSTKTAKRIAMRIEKQTRIEHRII